MGTQMGAYYATIGGGITALFAPIIYSGGEPSGL